MEHHVSRVDARCGEVNLFFFGDLQFGADGFVEEAWQDFRHEFKTTKNAYAIGLGDYGDWLRPTMRTKLYMSLTGDDSARRQLDSMVLKLQDQLLKKMDFLEGRLLGLHSGHHEHEWTSGGNSTQRLASGLKATYLGWVASTRLTMSFGKESKDSTMTYTILSTHGSQNSRTTSGAAAAFERSYAESFVVDQYVGGHGCKSDTWVSTERHTIRRQGSPGADLSVPRFMLVGGFCRGYTDGHSSSYVERNSMKPQPVGWGLVNLKRCCNVEQARAEGKNPRTWVMRVTQSSRGPGIPFAPK